MDYANGADGLPDDYLYTGNSDLLEKYYDDLKAKTLMALADENGFISTTTGKVAPEVLESIHFKGTLRDIVDWPHTGILGLGKNEGGETDGFVFRDVNTVVNAYHYRALVLMGYIAGVTGRPSDGELFVSQAEKLKHAFNQFLFDKKWGVYVDGVGTDHAPVHTTRLRWLLVLFLKSISPGLPPLYGHGVWPAAYTDHSSCSMLCTKPATAAMPFNCFFYG